MTAVLPEGRGSLVGKLQFVDNLVDAGSGTVKVKAVFDNRDERLWPGAYVNVSMVVRTLKGAITLPQAAIIPGMRGTTVYVVGEDRKAAQRPVEVLESVGSDAVVKGVRPGERVVLDGRENVRPGGLVVERSGDGASAPQRARGGASGASASTAP